MKYSILSFTLLLCSFTQLLSQNSDQPVKCMKVTDVSVQTGLYSETHRPVNLYDFYTLAPQSAILNWDLSSYSPAGGYYFNASSFFNMAMGMDFRNKEKNAYRNNPHLRVGISYFSVTGLNYGLFKVERKPYDTLTSTQTGQTTYVDSVITETIYMDHKTEQLRLDASLLFRTDPAARFSLFCGLGATAGATLNAASYIHYSRSGHTESYTPGTGHNGGTYFSNGGEGKSEVFTNKNCFVASAYLPLGFDVRLGKTHEFWRKVHLFWEVRPGISTISIPELRTFTSTNIQFGFGIKVTN